MRFSHCCNLLVKWCDRPHEAESPLPGSIKVNGLDDGFCEWIGCGVRSEKFQQALAEGWRPCRMAGTPNRTNHQSLGCLHAHEELAAGRRRVTGERDVHGFNTVNRRNPGHLGRRSGNGTPIR